MYHHLFCTRYQPVLDLLPEYGVHTDHPVYSVMPTHTYIYALHSVQLLWIYPCYLSHSRWPSQCDVTDRRCDGAVPNSPTAASESAPGAQQHILLA